MRPLRPGLWNLVTALADKAVEHWEHRDHGMWEVRDRNRHFLSSRLLCWTALDRALAIAHRDGLSGPLERWDSTRAQMRQVILNQGFDPALGFKRALDEAEPDATGLLLPRYGFLPAEDPRVVRTVDVVSRRLSAGDGLLRRYLAPDGLPGSEGAFTACSFWLVDCLARQGRVDEARRLFDDVVARTSDLGLLSEQVDPRSGALLGNYPQAFSHLALIRAATVLADAEEKLRPRRLPARTGITRPSRPRTVARGVGAGAVATVAMSAVLLAAERAGLMHRLPPKKITRTLLDRFRVQCSESAENATATVAHFGYGAVAGGLFELVRGRLAPAHPLAEGVLFSTFAWAASYFGWIPALGITPRSTRDRPTRPLSMLLSHVVYGAVLGGLTLRGSRKERR